MLKEFNSDLASKKVGTWQSLNAKKNMKIKKQDETPKDAKTKKSLKKMEEQRKDALCKFN